MIQQATCVRFEGVGIVKWSFFLRSDVFGFVVPVDILCVHQPTISAVSDILKNASESEEGESRNTRFVVQSTS